MTLLAVPNISEGRRPELVRDIAGHSPTLLDVHIDPDHNRSVLTYGGDIATTLLAMIDRAVAKLDINAHQGVHPRSGVVDVLPIIAYGEPADEAIRLADRLAREAPIPTYRYTDDLPALRRRLRAEHDAHPTAGVLCIGVRGPLIAFNVNLDADLEAAKAIAREVRRLPGARALAFELPSRGLVQVSMNLVEPATTGPRRAYERISELTPAIVDAEVVGLVPASNAKELEGIPLRTPARTIEDALRG